MQQAKCTLVLDIFKNSIPLKDVTPPEAVVLRRAHQKNAGCDPVQNIVLTGMVSHSASEEMARLRRKYKAKKFEEAYPGENPKLPETFQEVGYSVPLPPKPIVEPPAPKVQKAVVKEND